MANSPAKAHILTCYYRPKPGGFCRRLFQAIEALLAQGHDVHYLSVVPFPINHPQCTHHRFPWPPSKTHGFWFWACFHSFAPLMLLALALRQRTTHLFAFGHNYGFLLQATRLICRQPLAVFLRADVMETHRLKGHPLWLIRLDALIETFGLYRARVYCVSQALARRVRSDRRHCQPLSVEVLQNALPTLDLPRTNSELAALPLRLTSAGILEERKNIALLVHMMASIPPGRACLDIYGTGPLERTLNELVSRLGIQQQVKFKGWCNDSNQIWRNTDLLLFPSRHEGSPNTVLEALAAGIAILASDTPEHREILPPASLLPLGDPQAWAEAVQHITQDPDTRLRALRTQQEAKTTALRFDWDETIVRAIVHDSILGKHHA